MAVGIVLPGVAGTIITKSTFPPLRRNPARSVTQSFAHTQSEPRAHLEETFTLFTLYYVYKIIKYIIKIIVKLICVIYCHTKFLCVRKLNCVTQCAIHV